MFGDLDGHSACVAGGPKDEDRLTRLERHPTAQGNPRGHRRVHGRSNLDDVDGLRQRDASPHIDDRLIGHRTPGVVTGDEVDQPAIAHPPNPIDPGNHRQHPGTRVVPPRCIGTHPRMQPRSQNVDKHLIRPTRDGRIKNLVPRRVLKRPHNRRMHAHGVRFCSATHRVSTPAFKRSNHHFWLSSVRPTALRVAGRKFVGFNKGERHKACWETGDGRLPAHLAATERARQFGCANEGAIKLSTGAAHPLLAAPPQPAAGVSVDVPHNRRIGCRRWCGSRRAPILRRRRGSSSRRSEGSVEVDVLDVGDVPDPSDVEDDDRALDGDLPFGTACPGQPPPVDGVPAPLTARRLAT